MKLSTVDAFKHIQSKDALVLSDEQLLALQKTLTDMLRDVDTLCRKHGLSYHLGGGSCLGAVRHHGFIPWDDDIDINMPRRDHDRFIPLFKEEYGDRYWIHTAQETENYGLCFSRVLLKGTSVKTREDFHNEECGAFIDIFVIENTFDMPLLRYLHGFGCLALGYVQSCGKFFRDRKELMALIENETDPERKKNWKKVFRLKILTGRVFSFFPLDTWTHLTDRWYHLCRNHRSRYVSVPSGRRHFFGELYLRDGFVNTVEMPYEGEPRPVPSDYDGYLRRMYGDYHVIPKEENREKHVFFKPFYLNEDDK